MCKAFLLSSQFYGACSTFQLKICGTLFMCIYFSTSPRANLFLLLTRLQTYLSKVRIFRMSLNKVTPMLPSHVAKLQVIPIFF